MIRIILIVLFLFLFLVLGLPVQLFLAIVGKINPDRRDRMSFYLVNWGFRVVRFIAGIQLEVKGYENIPKDTAVLYVSNHRSYFDIIIGYSILKPLCGFVSKVEIKKIPLLAGWMKRVKCLFLDRSDMKAGIKMINDGVEQLKKGISMFIFPEGTRARNGAPMAEFKEGSLKMALKAGVPVVPVAYVNTNAIWEDHMPSVKKAKVIVEFGQPIYTDSLDKEEKKHLGLRAHDLIEAMYEKNKNLL